MDDVVEPIPVDGLRSGVFGLSTARADELRELEEAAREVLTVDDDPYWFDGAAASADAKSVYRDVLGDRRQRETDAAARESDPPATSRFL